MADYGDVSYTFNDDEEKRKKGGFPYIGGSVYGQSKSPLDAALQAQVPLRQGQGFFPGANTNQFALSLDPRNATSFVPQFTPAAQYAGQNAPRPQVTPTAPPAPGYFANAAAQYGRGLTQSPGSQTPFLSNNTVYPAGSQFPGANLTAPIRQAPIAPPQGRVPDPFGYISMARAQSKGRNPMWTGDEWMTATGGYYGGY